MTPTFKVREDTPRPNTLQASIGIYLKPGQIGQYPLCEHAHCKSRENRSSTQSSSNSPMLWFYPNHRTINHLKRNVHGGHTSPFGKKEEEDGMQRIGTVTHWKISKWNCYQQNPQHLQTYDVPGRYCREDQATQRMG